MALHRCTFHHGGAKWAAGVLHAGEICHYTRQEVFSSQTTATKYWVATAVHQEPLALRFAGPVHDRSSTSSQAALV